MATTSGPLAGKGAVTASGPLATSHGEAFTSSELQTIVAARSLSGKRSCFIGVGRPSTAALLARMVHNPRLVLVYESGTIGAKPYHVPLSVGDGELAETADLVVSVPEMFNYWIGPGRVQVAFLGAAQVDPRANLNSTVIGDYEHPRTRLPGAGGAPEIATGCQEVVVIAPHNRRTFVDKLDFKTTSGDRTTLVITDLGVLEPIDGELTLTTLHPGVTVEQVLQGTGWELRVLDRLGLSAAPSADELEALRELIAR
jgi:glutaconate CoA-transferase, subunit B